MGLFKGKEKPPDDSIVGGRKEGSLRIQRAAYSGGITGQAA